MVFWCLIRIQKNVRRAANIKSPLTGHFLELDIWFPDLKLCFEFQVLNIYIKLNKK